MLKKLLERSQSLLILGVITLFVIGILGYNTGTHAKTNIKIAFSVTANNLDPAKFKVGGIEYTFGAAVFSGLTRFDAKLNALPDLAENWESSSDLTVWTFNLRKGVKFHNGRELDAKDVISSMERIRDPAIGSTIKSSLDIVSKIEAIDSHTVRFTLSLPYADFPSVLAVHQAKILPYDLIDTIETAPVGTGPFKFVEYMPGDHILLQKNPDYWETDMPKADEITLQVIPEYASSIGALEAGELDVVFNLPPEQIDLLSDSQNAHVDEVPSGQWYALVMHNEKAPFNDERVRKAFIKLSDKKQLTEVAVSNHGSPTHTPIPPGNPFYNNDLPFAGPDIEGAKKLLNEAGYGGGLTVQLWIPSSNTVLQRIAVAFREMAKQANVNVEVNPVPDDKLYGEIEGKEPFEGTYFSGKPTPDLMLYPWLHSTGSWNGNLWHYKSSEVDDILDKARRAKSEEEQKSLYGRLQEIIETNGPGIIIFVLNQANGVSNRIEGYVSIPTTVIDLRNIRPKE